MPSICPWRLCALGERRLVSRGDSWWPQEERKRSAAAISQQPRVEVDTQAALQPADGISATAEDTAPAQRPPQERHTVVADVGDALCAGVCSVSDRATGGRAVDTAPPGRLDIRSAALDNQRAPWPCASPWAWRNVSANVCTWSDRSAAAVAPTTTA